MFKPSLDGASRDSYRLDLDDVDVHYGFGVANHFFYLMAEGAVVPAGFGAGAEAGVPPADLVCGSSTALKEDRPQRRGRSGTARSPSIYMRLDTDYARGARGDAPGGDRSARRQFSPGQSRRPSMDGGRRALKISI